MFKNECYNKKNKEWALYLLQHLNQLLKKLTLKINLRPSVLKWQPQDNLQAIPINNLSLPKSKLVIEEIVK